MQQSKIEKKAKKKDTKPAREDRDVRRSIGWCIIGTLNIVKGALEALPLPPLKLVAIIIKIGLISYNVLLKVTFIGEKEGNSSFVYSPLGIKIDALPWIRFFFSSKEGKEKKIGHQ